MSNYIKNLITKGEHQQQDFKYEISDSRKIARSLVAFANTDGGRLLVGVKDNGAIAGADPNEEFYMIQAAAQMYSKPEVVFESKSWNVEGKTVLEITVPKSKNRPHSAPNDEKRWRVYIRVQDKNILANSVLLKVWKGQKRKIGTLIEYSEAEKAVLSYLEKNETATINKICSLAQTTRKKAEYLIVNLILTGIVEIVFTEKQVYYKLSY